MANIRIERLPVQSFYLGYFGFDHLQLALEQDSLTSVPIPQDEWFVMEGTRQTTSDGVKLGTIGEGGRLPMRITAGGYTGSELIDVVGTPESRGSSIIASGEVLSTWDIMAAWARDIADGQFNYQAYGSPRDLRPTLNSTSFIASLLFAAGLDVASNMPRGLRFSPGTETLLGSFSDDHLKIEGNFTAIFGNLGADLLEGTNDASRIDRLYGGGGNDLLGWSQGLNYLHGGDSSWSYADDGFDTVDYTGAGNVSIEIVRGSVEHLTPQYKATSGTGQDYLMSIERLLWSSDSSETITTGPGVELMLTPLSLYLGGQASGDRGDVVDFSSQTADLLIKRGASDAQFVSAGNEGDGGLWVQSAEWIIGGAGNDSIYANNGLRGIEGGAGNDFIDAHLVDGFTGSSPQGYDMEIMGGAGDDTLIGNSGRVYLDGGDGADRYVLASLTDGTSPIELIIADADALDSLYVPYNYFNMTGDGYDGSQLMRIAGAIGNFTDMTNNGWELYHEFRLQEDIWTNTDETDGVIDFAGAISFRMEGADLIISLYKGERVADTLVIDDQGTTIDVFYNVILPDTETIIRVSNYQEGDLGLQFIDPGTIYSEFYQGQYFTAYTNWNAAVDALNQPMLMPFDAPPVPLASDPNDPSQSQTPPTRLQGTDQDDTIALNSPSDVDAGAGNDTITAQGRNNDTIDGGSGADYMAGGDGSDHYIVDDPGDTVVELASQGSDTVTASIDYMLPDNVENLTLVGTAIVGTGNAADNRILGNELANILSGGDGADMLFGDLGDDLLSGGNGGDTYSYVVGGGWDTIDDGGTFASDIDILAMQIGIDPADVSAIRLANAPDNLTLVIEGGGHITIAGAYLSATSGIEAIEFDDGTVWTVDDIALLMQSAAMLDEAPPEANDDGGYVYGLTDGILLTAPLLANDFDYAGGSLTLIAVDNLSIGSATVTADGNIALSLPPGYEGPLSFRYTIANEAGLTAHATAEIVIVPNTVPLLSAPPSSQSANAGEAWSWTIASDLFTDADGDGLSYAVTGANGTALPAWLTYDAASQTIGGTPPAGLAGDMTLRIVAYDGFTTSETSFVLTIADASTPGQTIAGTSGDDNLVGGGGNDVFTILGNSTGFDTYDGAGGYDTISGSPWNDTIGLANAPDKLLGIEAIDGGTGTDKILLTTGNDTLDLSAIAVSSIELIDAGGGSDWVIGSAGADTIRGNAGNDALEGGGGDDTFTIVGNAEGFDFFLGGDGFDTILGSPWNDTIALDNVAGNLDGIEAIDGGTGTDKILLTTGNDTLNLSAIAVSSIELIDAGGGSDWVIGSAGADTIRGNAGNDTLEGGGGDDTFTIVGNAEGFDVFLGGDGFDTILGSPWNDTIALDNVAGNLLGIERIDGGEGTDKILGTSGDDVLDFSTIELLAIELIDAGGGNDTITGSEGSDIMRGGTGSDTFISGLGNDRILDFTLQTLSSTTHDLIDFSSPGHPADFDAVLAASTMVGSDTVIDLGGSNSLTLVGTNLQALTADYFVFA
ncbi:MAG: cadherin-like domain-containing protein [Hyphomicrobiaceae bacterium]|nr:cadherin-like domain-containing protein [Hyphomicrobiaceae bacterium]